MAQPDTVQRILDAAESLFADKGFAETSLRQITGKAQVNLAAVNYHFGSKKSLIQAVFARFLDPFCESLEQTLKQRQTDEKSPLTLESLLQLLVEQALAIKPRSGQDLSIFMRLLVLAFTESQGHLRRFLNERYGNVWRHYMGLLQQTGPQISPVELFWRVHFMIGTVAFSMSGLKALRAISESDFSTRVSTEQVMRLMLPFLAAGMQAPGAGPELIDPPQPGGEPHD